MSKIILISGKAESGKTTLSNMMKRDLEASGYRVTIISFASYLKNIAKEHFGWDGVKDDKGRTILQEVGTNKVRVRNPNFWVETVYNFIETFSDDFDYFISDDVRFPNEIEFFRNLDVMAIRLHRVNHVSKLDGIQLQHPSETALDNYKDFDAHIYAHNGLPALRQCLLDLYNGSDTFFPILDEVYNDN